MTQSVGLSENKPEKSLNPVVNHDFPTFPDQHGPLVATTTFSDIDKWSVFIDPIFSPWNDWFDTPTLG